MPVGLKTSCKRSSIAEEGHKKVKKVKRASCQGSAHQILNNRSDRERGGPAI